MSKDNVSAAERSTCTHPRSIPNYLREGVSCCTLCGAFFDGDQHSAIVDDFWRALGKNQEYYTKPEKVYDDPIYRIKTKDAFMFDDGFWEVFQAYPFKICHITFLDVLLTGEGGSDEKVFDLRFALKSVAAP